MGSSYTNIQVHSKDYDGVVKVLQENQFLPTFVSPASENGWISVYPRLTESQDDNDLKSVACALSKNLKAGVFGLLVHDSDIFMYVLYETGMLKDEYNSDPGYFDGKNNTPTGGDMAALARYCVPGTTAERLASTFTAKKQNLLVGAATFMWHLARKDIDKAFSSTVIFRGDTLAGRFGESLGVDGERISVGYKYIKQGDCKGLTLLRNEKEDLERAQGKGGAPVLMTEMDFNLRGVAPEHRQMYELHSQRAESMLHDVNIGSELNWNGTVKNEGGYSKGIRLKLRGPALDSGLFASLTARAERWQRGGEEDDYEGPDSDDATFWPFVKPYTRSNEPGVWVAEFPDFVYTTDILVRLPVIPAVSGEARLELSIEPMDPQGRSNARFPIGIKAIPPKPLPPVKQGKASGYQSVGQFKINFPPGYDVSVQDGGGFMEMLGIKHQLRAFRHDNEPDQHTQMDLSISKIEKEEDAANMHERLKWVRSSNRCRDFQPMPVERTVLGGMDFEIVRWSSPDMHLYGVLAVARKGDQQVFSHAVTSNAVFQKELHQILMSLQ